MSGVTLSITTFGLSRQTTPIEGRCLFPSPALLLLLLLLHEAFPGSLFWNPTVEAFGSTNHRFGNCCQDSLLRTPLLSGEAGCPHKRAAQLLLATE